MKYVNMLLIFVFFQCPLIGNEQDYKDAAALTSDLLSKLE